MLLNMRKIIFRGGVAFITTFAYDVVEFLYQLPLVGGSI